MAPIRIKLRMSQGHAGWLQEPHGLGRAIRVGAQPRDPGGPGGGDGRFSPTQSGRLGACSPRERDESTLFVAQTLS